MRGSSATLPLEQALLIGGTSAVAAAVTPMLTRPFFCQHRPTTPLVNAVVSSGLVYALMLAESVDSTGAAMFLPVQILSTLLAYQVAHMLKKRRKKAEATF